MKRILMVVAAVVLIGVVGFLAWNALSPKGPKVSQPFALNAPFEADTITAYLEGDDVMTLKASSPFYFGPQYPGQKTDEYIAARGEKVREIISDSDKVAELAVGLKSEVEEMRKALYDYLQVCIEAEPKSENYARSVVGKIVEFKTKEALAEAAYQSVDTSSKDEFAKSFMEYSKFAKAVELGDLYLKDVYTMTVAAGLGLEMFKDTSNQAIIAANKKLDNDMNVFDSMSKPMANMAATLLRIDYGMKQLKTGDHYFAVSAVEFMRASIPGLKKQMEDVKSENAIPQEVIDLANESLEAYDGYSAALEKVLNSVPESELIPVSEMPHSPISSAYAQGSPTPPYVNACNAVSAPNPKGEPEEGWLAKGWRVLVKQPVHAVQSGAGALMDTAGATIRSGAQTGMSFWYGGTWSDLGKDIKNNYREVYTNWQNDMSGVSTMRTAKEYFDAVDKGAEDLASGGAEKVFGKGWISWGTGKVANATSGMFTGLGRGISLVGNRQADTADYVQGGIEIASAAIGGSKLAVRGTQVPGITKGLGQTGALSVQRVWNAAGKVFTKLDQFEIDDLIKTCVTRGMELGSLKGRKAIVDATLAAIEATNAQIRSQLGRILEGAVAAAKGNAAATFKGSIEDFVKKQFSRNMKGVYEAVRTVLGKNAKDYVDNVVGQWVETALKDMVAEIWREAPLPAELKGVFTGTMTFTDIQVPTPTEEQKKQGCDFTELVKALKDKPLATKMVLDGAPSGAGSLSLSIKAGEKSGNPVNARYVYKDGTIKVNQGVEGFLLVMDGRAYRQDKGYVMEGTVVMSGGKPGSVMRFSGGWKVRK